MINNQFSQDDQKGRNVLEQKAINALLYFSSNPKTKHDGYLFSGITIVDIQNENLQRFVFEIKKRSRIYDEMLIEKKKYDHLLNLCEKYKHKNLLPLYINVIENQVYAWNLHDHKNIDWQMRWMPATTSISTQKKKKEVGFLHINKSFQI